jgi:hypothetical protein
MKLPNWFKIIWWVFLLIIVSVFLYNRYPHLTAGTSTTADIFIFLIWVALCLLPLFEELSFFGITFKKEVEKLKSDIAIQFDNLKTDIKNTINLQVIMPTAGQIPPSQVEESPKRRPIEFKILNTLWTKQVNKFPDFSGVWTFRINANAHEFMAFREAGNKLLGERLIGETDQGQFYLTPQGFQYCKEHYKEFGSDQWWPEETINEENLKKVLQKT